MTNRLFQNKNLRAVMNLFLVIFLIFVLGAIIVVFSILGKLGRVECKYNYLSNIPAPDNQYTAVSFTQNCGINGIDTAVKIIPQKSDQTKNNKKDIIFKVESYSRPDIEWKSVDNLKITYKRSYFKDEPMRIWKKENHYKNINIEYEEVINPSE